MGDGVVNEALSSQDLRPSNAEPTHCLRFHLQHSRPGLLVGRGEHA